MQLNRLASQVFVEITFPTALHFHKFVPISAIGERAGRKFLKEQVKDPEVRKKLTPDYPVGCKRPGFHNTYLAHLQPRQRLARDRPDRGDHAELGPHRRGRGARARRPHLRHRIQRLRGRQHAAVPGPRRRRRRSRELVGREPLPGLPGRERPRLPQHLHDPRSLRLQRLVVLQPDREPGEAHPAPDRAGAARGRDEDRGHARGERALLQEDARAPPVAGPRAALMPARQLVLLRQARRPPVPLVAHARGELATAATSTSTTTRSRSSSPPPSPSAPAASSPSA